MGRGTKTNAKPLTEPSATVEIKPGDVVQLKSGGPVMSVQSVRRNDKDETVAHVAWFDPRVWERHEDGDTFEHQATFNTAALRRVS